MKNLEPVRKYLYSLLVPVAAVLVYYGIVEADAVPIWVGAAAAVLGIGAVETARAKVTPTNKVDGGTH